MVRHLPAEQHAGAFVLVLSPDRTRVLVGKRKNAYKAGSWGFPGGRVDVGEPLAACARRELVEETGLVPSNLRYVGVIRENQGAYDFIHFVYACTAFLGDPELKEPEKCEGWEWRPVIRLPGGMLPAHAKGLDLYRSKKHFLDLA